MNPSDPSITTANYSADHSEAEDVMSMLPVAAHMKLLLDAPEGECCRVGNTLMDEIALYSFLSHRSYLSAAFLWLVTRVVKEGLSSMPDNINVVLATSTSVTDLY